MRTNDRHVFPGRRLLPERPGPGARRRSSGQVAASVAAVAALALTACGGVPDGEAADATTTTSVVDETTTTTAVDDGTATTSTTVTDPGGTTGTTSTDGSTTDTTAGEAPPFEASLDDPVYVDLLLDCLYGENEAGSCEQLEAAGLDADDAYGLGNALTQAPNDLIREDCIGGDPLACAELNARVELVATQGADEPRLLCLFYSTVVDGTATDVDLAGLQALLGDDVPPGVLAAIILVAGEPGAQDAIDVIDGYIGPICEPFLG